MKFQIRGAEGFNRVYVPFITPWVVDIETNTPPPLLFPVSSFVLSERCTEKPVSSMAESGTIADIQVSVRQITQQSLVSRWYEMRARSSQSLLSSDWTLASKMVGRGGRKARHLSLTRTPALFPLFRRRRRVDFATHTMGSDAVSVNSPSALKNSKSGLRCTTEEPMFKSVSLS